MLSVHTFQQMGRLSGLVPLVGVASGYCFAGNAALLGLCDVVIATKGSNVASQRPERQPRVLAPLSQRPAT